MNRGTLDGESPRLADMQLPVGWNIDGVKIVNPIGRSHVTFLRGSRWSIFSRRFHIGSLSLAVALLVIWADMILAARV